MNAKLAVLDWISRGWSIQAAASAAGAIRAAEAVAFKGHDHDQFVGTTARFTVHAAAHVAHFYHLQLGLSRTIAGATVSPNAARCCVWILIKVGYLHTVTISSTNPTIVGKGNVAFDRVFTEIKIRSLDVVHPASKWVRATELNFSATSETCYLCIVHLR